MRLSSRSAAGAVSLLAAASLFTAGCAQTSQPELPGPTVSATQSPAPTIPLPPPNLEGTMSVEEALAQRRSARDFATIPLTLAEASQLLWAAQGETSDSGARTAPSAGALYPLEVLLVAGEVAGLPAGVYRYDPTTSGLTLVAPGDRRDDLAEASLGQEPIRAAPASLVITGVYARTEVKYGDRSEQFVHMEAGHAAQNVYLQATAMGLGTVSIGAIDEEQGRQVLNLPADETPLYVMPVGRVG